MTVMHPARFVLVVAALLLAPLDLLAQRPSAPALPVKGAGVIRGRVLAADTGRPLRRAQISLAAAELGSERRTANTGLDGRYEIKDLPEGRYTLTVTRSGYLSMQYGQQRPLEQPRPLQLSEAQAMESVDFSLPRAAAISGRIVDDAGEAIAGVNVWAMRPMYIEGRRQLVVASTGALQGSDDTGSFRIAGLVPGTYYLRASSRETWIATVEGVRTSMGFAPTFFPGTAGTADARLIEVTAGQQIRDIDFPLVPSRTATLSGLAVDSRGRPLSGRSVGLTHRFLQGGGGAGMMTIGSAPVAGDGSFTLRSVPPGEYDLTVSTGNPGSGDGEVASTRITVNGVDIDNLRVATTAGWSISGRVVTEDGEVPVFAGSGRAGVRVASVVNVPMSGVGLGNGQVNDDGTFAIRAIVGPSRIVANVPAGWMVKSIRHNDRDVTGALLDMASGEELSAVEVVVSTRVTSVIGQITDSRGAPLGTATVLVFADDAEKWGESSSFVRVTRPDQQGRYEIRGLPVGDYLAVALDYLQNGTWNDPEFLESLRRDARRFRLADGASQALPLRVSEAP